MSHGYVVEGTHGIQKLRCSSCKSDYIVETKNIQGNWVLIDGSLADYCPKCKKIFERKYKIEKLKKNNERKN